MALDDICEKDPYLLRNIQDVIISTQGSNYFTVIDLKEGFYNIEINVKDKKKKPPNLKEGYMNGTRW